MAVPLAFQIQPSHSKHHKVGTRPFLITDNVQAHLMANGHSAGAGSSLHNKDISSL